MYYSDYSLQQLLELALRVPEVGAVNFNVLYYVLKTIIKKMGLEGIKPVFSLDESLNEEYKEESSSSEEVGLKKSHSAESLPSTTKKKTPKMYAKDKEDTSKSKTHDDTESARWDTIKLPQKNFAVEDETSEIHSLIAQFIDRIADFERALNQQEMKFLKEITDMKHSMLKSKKEDQNFVKKLEKLSSDVSMLKHKELNYDGEDKSYTEELDKESEEPIRESRTHIKEEELDKESEETIRESRTHIKEEELDEESKEKTSESEIPIKEEVFDEESKKKIKASKIPLKKDKERTEHSLESISENLEAVFKELDSIKKHLKKESSYDDSKASKKTPEKRKPETKDDSTQSEIYKIEVDVLNISLAVNKLMEKSSATDKKLQLELGSLHEKIDMLEETTTHCDEEMRYFQTNWNETLITFEYMKENLHSIEKQMDVLTEFPGLRHRVGQLEGYVYSGYEPQYQEGEEKRDSLVPAHPHAIVPGDQLKAEKELEKISVSDRKKLEPLVPSIKKFVNKEAKDLVDVIDEDKRSESDVPLHKKFKAYVRNVLLIQDMEKRKQISGLKSSDLYEAFDEDDDYMFEEPFYEETKKPAVDDSLDVSESFISKEIPDEFSSAEIKSSTYTSPDVLEDHSRQLKGEVIVFVKKRLHIFEIDLHRIEGSLVTVVKKVQILEKSMKELGERLNFLDSNFNQRFADFNALKDMTENHHLSIVTIMHQLDRKAEAYAVNQKVSRKELTVIEDRILKLCRTTSSEITKLEEKLSDSLKDFSLELNKMLLTEEFEIRLELLLHKIKLLEKKLKDTPIEASVLEFESIRPTEVKKYVLAKDGTRVKQTRRKVANWNHDSECIIPLLTQHIADRQISPKTALQVQKELESASFRESKRYVEGAYTKIKVGRK